MNHWGVMGALGNFFFLIQGVFINPQEGVGRLYLQDIKAQNLGQTLIPGILELWLHVLIVNM